MVPFVSPKYPGNPRRAPSDQITAVGNRGTDGRMFVHLEKIVFDNGKELAANVLWTVFLSSRRISPLGA
jgi:hypothetical protein